LTVQKDLNLHLPLWFPDALNDGIKGSLVNIGGGKASVIDAISHNT
jgi:hypothetical protein